MFSPIFYQKFNIFVEKIGWLSYKFIENFYDIRLFKTASLYDKFSIFFFLFVNVIVVTVFGCIIAFAQYIEYIIVKLLWPVRKVFKLFFWIIKKIFSTKYDNSRKNYSQRYYVNSNPVNVKKTFYEKNNQKSNWLPKDEYYKKRYLAEKAKNSVNSWKRGNRK